MTNSNQHYQLQEHLAAIGLSTEIINNPDIEYALRQLFEVNSNSDGVSEAEAGFEIIRHVRGARRFDLLVLCESILSNRMDDRKIARELILLYIDAGDWLSLRGFLELRPDITVDLSSHTLLQLVPQRDSSSVAQQLEIWPNERLGYAAKTAILNVSTAVVTRQRSFIDALLDRLARSNPK
jgi:hypothetical protein